MAARWLLIFSLAACDRVSGLSDFEIGTGGQGGTTSDGGTAGSSDGGTGGVPPPCAQQPVDSPTTTIEWMPNPLTTLDAPVVNVTDVQTPFTYVALVLCTPTETRVIDNVESILCSAPSTPPCTWTFRTTPLPDGITQAAFTAMRQTTPIETAAIAVVK